MLCAPPVSVVVTQSTVPNANANAVQPEIAEPPEVKLTVPPLGAGPAPVTVAVNVTDDPNAAGLAGLAASVTVGVAFVIE